MSTTTIQSKEIPSTWTRHELGLLEMITCCVNSARLEHLQCCWDSGPSPPPFELSHALDRVTAATLMSCHLVNVHPPLNPISPVYSRPLDGPIPDYKTLKEISQALRSRWSKNSVPTRIYVPTKKTANLFGSTAVGLPPLEHRDHDLLLTDVFFLYLRRSPAIAKNWIGEHIQPKAGHKVKDPDAFLIRNGEPYRIVESGGSYSVGQLTSILQHAEERSLDLEIW